MYDAITLEPNGKLGHTTSNATSPIDKAKIPTRKLLELIESQGYLCALSGRPLEPATAGVDHVVPVSRGGSHDIENVQVIHRDVNQAKSTMTNEEFIAMCREVVAWADRESGE